MQLKADLEELSALTDANSPLDVQAMRAAFSYVEQWRLMLWTGDCNRRLGVAPSTESVLRRYEEQRLGLPEAVRPDARGTTAAAQSRVWAGAWRRRWHVKHGAIKVREQLSAEQMRDKVSIKIKHRL